MSKRTLESLEGPHLEGQRALVRVDFNVPIKEGGVADRTRIKAAIPTIEWLRAQGCRVVLFSHLGRPKGRPDPDFSLRPVAGALEEELGIPVRFIAEPLGQAAVQETKRLRRGEVALLENTRFHPGEETNDEALARSFADLGDLYVNDAFGSAHRAHASTEAIAGILKPAVAGFLMARELEYLGKVLSAPEPPFVAVLGGAKISGKIDVIESLLPVCDRILIGGAMACTFFRAQGLEVGNSLVEEEKLEVAAGLLERAGEKLMLPVGAVVAPKLESDTTIKSVSRTEIPEEWAVYDIDEGTRVRFQKEIVAARTVVWNGPMGVFETPPFDQGTIAIARALARATEGGATTVVGGGDSAAAVAQAGLTDQVSHVSTGGGASLEFLEGKALPGVAALDNS